jgi:shikimate dehydrogenase
MFMEKGSSKGATIKNGYEMLLQQAMKSYKIWNME